MSSITVRRRRDFRNSIGIRFAVRVDNEVVGRIWMGRSITRPVDAGAHLITVTAGFGNAASSDEVPFVIAQDQHLTFVCGPNADPITSTIRVFRGRPNIEIHQAVD